MHKCLDLFSYQPNLLDSDSTCIAFLNACMSSNLVMTSSSSLPPASLLVELYRYVEKLQYISQDIFNSGSSQICKHIKQSVKFSKIEIFSTARNLVGVVSRTKKQSILGQPNKYHLFADKTNHSFSLYITLLNILNKQNKLATQTFYFISRMIQYQTRLNYRIYCLRRKPLYSRPRAYILTSQEAKIYKNIKSKGNCASTYGSRFYSTYVLKK